MANVFLNFNKGKKGKTWTIFLGDRLEFKKKIINYFTAVN